MTPINPDDAKAFMAAIEATAASIAYNFHQLPPDTKAAMIELEPHLTSMRIQLLTWLFEEGQRTSRRIPRLTFQHDPVTVGASET